MWDSVVWASLAVAIVAGIAAMARAALLALRAWRDLRETQRALFTELDRVAAAGEVLGTRAASLGDASERLTRSLERLTTSRRKLAVLQSALDEATDAAAFVTAVYPRK